MAGRSKNKNKNSNKSASQNTDSNGESPQVKKKFHIKDLKKFRPLTVTQERTFEIWNDSTKSMFLNGSAGTGKTFISLYLALSDLLCPELGYDKIVIIRSVVPSRDIGFLPGSAEEKIEVYEKPYKAICDEFFPFTKSYENLKALGKIDFEPTSYLRGTTFKNCIVIVDEAQNMTFQELSTVITRLGNDCRIIFSGDSKQNDLVQKRFDVSGFNQFLSIIEKMRDYFSVVTFNHMDIVRSDLVRDFIVKSELVTNCSPLQMHH